MRAVTELARFHDKSPDQLRPREVQRFLVHLLEERGLSWGSSNVHVHGLTNPAAERLIPKVLDNDS